MSSPNNLSNSVEAGMQCTEAVPRASCALWKRAWTEAAFSTSLGRTKIDAYADDGGGFALVADGFDQDTAEFVPAGDQIVRPLDLYVQTRCG